MEMAALGVIVSRYSKEEGETCHACFHQGIDSSDVTQEKGKSWKRDKKVQLSLCHEVLYWIPFKYRPKHQHVKLATKQTPCA